MHSSAGTASIRRRRADLFTMTPLFREFPGKHYVATTSDTNFS